MNIEALYSEAQVKYKQIAKLGYTNHECLKSVVDLVVAEERERCAKIVEGKLPVTDPEGRGEAMVSFKLLPIIAAEIRRS